MRNRRRLELLGGLAFVAAAVAVGLSAGGDAGSPAAMAVDTSAPQAHRAIAGDVAPNAKSSPARPVALSLPRRGNAVLYVQDRQRVQVRTAPGGRLVKTIGPRTEFGSRTVFSVVRTDGPWAGVITPLLANGELGWVRLDPRRLGSYRSDWAVDVDLSARHATLSRGGKVMRSFAVTVGAPGTETPTGRFSITDTFRGGLNPAYGCCAAALSAHQPKIPSGWLGGSRIAIHGTYDALGLALSHGCIRASNADIGAIVAHVPIGSHVLVHS
jgi:hypothetical protein